MSEQLPPLLPHTSCTSQQPQVQSDNPPPSIASPAPLANLTYTPVANVTDTPLNNHTHTPVINVTDPPVTNATNTPVTNVTDTPVRAVLSATQTNHTSSTGSRDISFLTPKKRAAREAITPQSSPCRNLRSRLFHPPISPILDTLQQQHKPPVADHPASQIRHVVDQPSSMVDDNSTCTLDINAYAATDPPKTSTFSPTIATQTLPLERPSSGNTSESTRQTCCETLSCFANTDPKLLEAEQCKVLGMNKNQIRQLLKDMLNGDEYRFNSRPVCSIFITKAFGISRQFQAAVKRFSKKKTVKRQLAKLPPPSVVPKSQLKVDVGSFDKYSVVDFLEALSRRTCQGSLSINTSTEIHLPFFHKTEVYAEFCKNYNSQRAPQKSPLPIEFRYFCALWKEEVPYINVSRVTRNVRCDECQDIRCLLENLVLKENEATISIMNRFEQHHRSINNEKRHYKRARYSALQFPDRVCSIIIDASEEPCFHLPHFAGSPASKNGRALKIRLVGVLDHGLVTVPSLFLMTEELEAGANHMIEVIHRTLNSRSEKGPLPDELVVQLANSCGENKNKFTLSYFEFLVRKGVFREITVSFLPTGHSHEDIEALFSNAAKWLMHHDAVTIEDMVRELKQCCTPQPSVSIMRQIANISNLLYSTGCISSKMGHFDEYRFFKFSRAGNRVVNGAGLGYKSTLKVKKNLLDNWAELEGTTADEGMLVTCPDLSKIPASLISSPKGVKDVNARLDSVEELVSAEKMQSLRMLRDSVFRSRAEEFGWDLKNYLEKKVKNEWLEEEQVKTSRQPHEYRLGEFVAVLTDGDDESRFWIGKIVEMLEDEEGVCSKLKVHWYEPRARHSKPSQNIYRRRYRAALMKRQSRGARQPWTDLICVDTVLVSFPKLNVGGYLSLSVQKSLRACMPRE